MNYYTDDIDLFEDYNEVFYNTKTEFLIDGKRLEYDACATGTLKAAKEFYGGYVYIGSGHVYYINDTENVSKEKHHFFMKRNNFIQDENMEQKLGISWVMGHGYSRDFHSVTVKVNHLYEVTHRKKTIRAWFIRTTPRGFNFEDDKSYLRLFKKHIYPQERDRDLTDLTIILPTTIKIKLIEP